MHSAAVLCCTTHWLADEPKHLSTKLASEQEHFGPMRKTTQKTHTQNIELGSV